MANEDDNWKSHKDGILSKVRRKDGKRVYYVRITVNGRAYTEKAGTTISQAHRLRATRQNEIERARIAGVPWVPPRDRRRREREQSRRNVTFAAFSEIYLRDYAAKRVRPRWFADMMRPLVAEFGKRPLQELDQHAIDRYLARRAKERHPATVNGQLRFLRNVLNRAIEWEFLASNPTAKIKAIREPAPREVFFSEEETNRLVEHAPPHLRPVIQMALLTGMRRGELLELTWDRVLLDRRMVFLPKTKNGKQRWVPIGDDLFRLLRSLPKHVRTDRVFTYRGRPIAEIKRSWDTARTAAGIAEGHFHDLRHTWASRMVAKGLDLFTLMELGGWSDVTMVRRYAHFAPEQKIRAAKLLDGTARVTS